MRVAIPQTVFASAAFIEPRLDLNGRLDFFMPVMGGDRSFPHSAPVSSGADVGAPGARAAAATAPGDAIIDFVKAFPVFAGEEGERR